MIRRFALALTLLLACVAARGDDIRAFSLREAERVVAEGRGADTSIGGITRVAGMVHDAATGDVIIVGKAEPSLPPISLDDLVVALRSRLLRNEIPMVSIDRTDETDATGQQDVRFVGGLENTQFGRDLLASDILLKRYSLALMERAGGIESYLELYEEATRQEMQEQGHEVTDVVWLDDDEAEAALAEAAGIPVVDSASEQSRFWFHVRTEESFVTERDGVFVIEELTLGVEEETRMLGGTAPASSPGAAFAQDFSAAFAAASDSNPELRRLKTLFDLVAVAESVRGLGRDRPRFDFLLNKFSVAALATPSQYELVERVGVFKTTTETSSLVHLSGGIELDVLLLALNDGDVSALKHAVLKSRPSDRSLTWSVPLQGWAMPNDIDANRPPTQPSPSELARSIGFSLDAQRVTLDPNATTQPAFNDFATPPGVPRWQAENPFPLRRLTREERTPTGATLSESQGDTAEIGGVMLDGITTLSGNIDGQTVASGQFQLLGMSAYGSESQAAIAEHQLRQFITAAWAVYYCDEAPGISIDPIYIGADKQLVRYIGCVYNSDLGRVMRDADYLMKQWAVGTSAPDISGFADVDALMGPRGYDHGEASRRFWFVPRDMHFAVEGQSIVFKSGRVELKTEVLSAAPGVTRIDADEQFARFFTENFDAIAARYPVFDELLTYAKLVSLVQVMKREGVPLHSFLLANRTRVLAEASIDAVDTLSRPSRFNAGIRIEGGVNFEPVWTIAGQDEGHDGSHDLPIHALPPAKLRVGGTGTDIAVQREERPGIELVRRAPDAERSFSIGAPGRFADHAQLAIPARAVASRERRDFLNARIPTRWYIQDSIAGGGETLQFDDTNYEIDGYRPIDMQESSYVGMFITTDGRLRLVDKIGNEFRFDGAGQLDELHLGPDDIFRYDYSLVDSTVARTDAVPLRLTPMQDGVTRELTTPLPKRLSLTDMQTGASLTLEFGVYAGVYGYRPSDESNGTSPDIVIMSDGHLVLTDIDGNEVWFDLDYDVVRVRENQVASITHGRNDYTGSAKKFVENNTIVFDHRVQDLRSVIGVARLLDQNGTTMFTVRYDDLVAGLGTPL